MHDVVVIGAGSAGALLAAGLSADPARSVLLLEELTTYDEIDDWLIATAGDEFHAAGTCRMGSPDDPAVVIDTACRVIGYDGVRVCDASVMPDLPRANTNLTTVAIAQRLAWAIASKEMA